MTQTQDKLRSLVLTVLMIGSVFAGTVVIAGPAAADVQSLSVDAPDVQGQVSSTTQTVSIDVEDAGDDSTTTIQLDYSAASALKTGTITSSDVSVVGGGADISLGAVSDDTTANNVQVDISDSTPDGTAESYTVEITITHDTSSSQPNGVTYTASGDGVSASDSFDVTQVERVVSDGDTLFQGEDDFVIIDSSNNQLNVGDFERSSGDNAGVPLEEPIPTDQTTGSYDDGSSPPRTLTVQTPRVSSLEINNPNGEDISGGTISTGASSADVVAGFNFEVSEAAEITVENSNGLDVTDTAVSSAQVDGTDPAEFRIDLSDLSTNEEYTVTVAGADDLDVGAATAEATFTISSQEDAVLELDQDSAVQGENVRFNLAGAIEGDVHPVRIDANDLRDGATASDVFRDVGDTVDTGVGPEGNPVALVEFSNGVGQIRTGQLADGSAEVTLFNPVSARTVGSLATGDFDADDEADSQDLSIEEGSITLDNPTGSYVIGSDVTLNGSASAGIEDVVVYARDEGQYERVTEINVEGDDTFELEDFDLDGDADTNILSLPGNYRIATLDASAASLDDNGDGNPDLSVSSSDVSGAIGSQTSLRAVDQSLTVDYVSIINGQVATSDQITVEGVAPGQDEVSVSFYGPRGSYDRTTISADSNGAFSEENIDVGGNLDADPNFAPSTAISQGAVIMTVFHDGRDGESGDGTPPQVSFDVDGDGTITTPETNSFAALFAQLNANSNTQDQVISRIAQQTTEDTGSDDISRSFQFRLADPQTSINTVTSNGTENRVVVNGSEMTVAGVTNRQPDDTDITVEVTEGPSTAEFDITSTDQWGTDGRWNVTFDTSGAEPGNYTVEADDGRNSDIFTFQIVEPQPEPEPTASVTFEDQTLSSDGTVTVASVTMSEGGFVTIHDDTVGSDPIGSVVGTSDYLEPGTSQNVEVSVEATPGQHFAMPHLDTNGNEAYDFVSSNGAEDAPYTTAQGAPVLDGAQISAPSTPTPTEPPTDTPTPEPDTPTPEPDTATEEPTPSPTETGGQPGFGLVVSLLALIGAALIALRRRD